MNKKSDSKLPKEYDPITIQEIKKGIQKIISRSAVPPLQQPTEIRPIKGHRVKKQSKIDSIIYKLIAWGLTDNAQIQSLCNIIFKKDTKTRIPAIKQRFLHRNNAANGKGMMIALEQSYDLSYGQMFTEAELRIVIQNILSKKGQEKLTIQQEDEIFSVIYKINTLAVDCEENQGNRKKIIAHLGNELFKLDISNGHIKIVLLKIIIENEAFLNHIEQVYKDKYSDITDKAIQEAIEGYRNKTLSE